MRSTTRSLAFVALAASLAAAQEPARPGRLASRAHLDAAPEVASSTLGFAREGEAWAATNTRQGLRARITTAGLEVLALEEARPLLGFGLVRCGRADGELTLAAPVLRPTGAGIDLDRGGLIEWFRNEERGFEQGWTLAERPAGSGPLWFGLSLEGGLSALIAADGRSARLVDARGKARLAYHSLAAWDARGQALAARLEPRPGGLGIRVDDRDAVYPITVDPIVSAPTWFAEPDQASAWFGISVASAGDVDGDGFSDVIVGAMLYDHGQANEGRAFVYLGSPAGPSLAPDWVAESNQAGARFGVSVATAGDVNGDGFSDVIVGARDYDQTYNDEGAAFVYLGSPAGLAETPAWSVFGQQAGAILGATVATAGDVNRDGYSDVLVASESYDGGQTDEGRVYLYLGSASGLSTSPDWVAEGNQAGALFGFAVAAAGDVNGDGHGDVIIGASEYDDGEVDEGQAYLYLGTPAGLAATPVWTAQANTTNARFGWAVAPAGDVDADGYADVMVGAPRYSNGQASEGAAFLFLGSASGLGATAAWSVEGNQSGAELGRSVGPAGDVNCDGHSDVVVGAPRMDRQDVDEGVAFLYLGAPAGLELDSAWEVEGDQVGAGLGTWVESAGDTNGDGFTDVVLGAQYYDGGEVDEGRALVLFGSSELPVRPYPPSWLVRSGGSVGAAGDVDGDGYGDVLVTGEGQTLLFLGSPSGPALTPDSSVWGGQGYGVKSSVAVRAGDVDGDGFDDVLTSDAQFDDDQLQEGRAQVFLGSPTGLAPTPVWSRDGNVAFGGLGRGIAGGGDVNGDGYADILVGCDGCVGYSGRADLFLGSPSGPSTTPDWTTTGQAGLSLYGWSIAMADMNRDGYSDVLVGEPRFGADRGRVLLFLGSRAGLATAPSWSATGINDSWFGDEIAAGDVSGDGFPDVLVGAYAENTGGPRAGAAYLFLGGPGGPSATYDWRVIGDASIGGYLGRDVQVVGDVNGDGYGDVVVADPLYRDYYVGTIGRVYLYLGSASGLSTQYAWTITGSYGGTHGESLSGPIDVNGDGFHDVLMGTHGRGLSQIVLGNDGRGSLFVAPRQRQLGGAPLPTFARARSAEEFLVAVGLQPRVPDRWAATSLLRAYLEVEVVPVGEPFDGTHIERTPLGLSVDPLGGTLPLDALPRRTGPHDLMYRWRARVAFEGNPLFPHTRWFSASDNGLTEGKLRFLNRLPDATAAPR